MDALSPLLGAATQPPPGDLEDLCRALLEGVVSPQDAASRWEAASALVEAYPDQEAPQLTAAQLLELRRDGQSLLETWSALHRRFPQNRLALRMALRWMGRVGRQSEGAALLDAACLKPATTAEELVEEAELWVELKDHTQAALRFETALSKAPNAVKPRLAYARALHTRGRVWEAGRVLAGLPKGARLSESAKSTCEAITQAVKAARAVPQTYDSGDAVPSVALHSAISLFANRALPPRVGSALGGVILLTGSLGSGGAERQLTRLAIALHKSTQAARPVAGIRLAGDVEVVVSHTDQARGKNFFRKDLEEAGVSLHLLREQPAVDFDGLGLTDPTLEKLAPILPQQTRFGLHRLVPLLRARKPEVVYLWQDGAVLTAALAALIAGVPRIVISVRGLPPNIRTELLKDAYEPMYRALAQIPGVVFSANSEVAARAYTSWLDLDDERFEVLPNAVDPLPKTASDHSRRVWSAFDLQTPDAFTLGSVMRFNPNKRPSLWIDSFARFLDHHPTARAVLVGGGEGLGEARSRAKTLHIDDRVLFTGADPNVGFWLSKMDGFLLLSEFEGLPNVLIEAQLACVPVVSTPAGGAAETFEPSVTGLLLSSASKPDPDEIVRALCFLAENPVLRARMGAFGARVTRPRYALAQILERTVRLLKGPNSEATTQSPQAVLPPSPRRSATR